MDNKRLLILIQPRIVRMGGSVDPKCVLCGMEEECRDHLFFMCPIAAELWQKALNFVGVSSGPSQWHMLIPWFNGRRKKTLQTRFIAAAATRTMYVIWSMRNKKIFGDEDVNVTTSCREIIGGLKMKLGAIDVRNSSDIDRLWLGRMGMLP
ncbi:hypothetical protein QQ045_012924 [Rhodiola kirilowii]